MRLSLGLVALASFAVFALAGGACDDSPIVAARFCTAPLRRVGNGVGLASAFGGRHFQNPTEIVRAPGDRFYVLEQRGVVWRVARDDATATVAIDLSAKVVAGGEAGLLGLAVDPDFVKTGFVYVYYTAPTPTPIAGVVFQSILSRFESKDGGATLDPATEKHLLVVDQPFANHNGGKLVFGPDGFLYFGLGDGGSSGDPRGNAQNKNVLLGKILRIDPKSGDPYSIPPANPFASGGGRPEIYAYGLRNPWKFSFDRDTGDLWCADVGQDKYEEVDRIVLGGNYGWNIREGKHCYRATSCATDGLLDPVVEYGRADGISIAGGYVYRGKKLPDLVGKFLYGDFGSGRVWAVDKDASGAPVPKLLVESNLKISTFGEDVDGEIYVADYVGGGVSKLVSAIESSVVDGRGVLLSETGCFDIAKPEAIPEGAIAYDVHAPLWSDGAEKRRWLYVPRGLSIGVAPDGDFDVPPGSVAVKTFSIGGKRIETRLFVRYEDGSFVGYSYEWNDDQTDATLLPGAKTKSLDGGGSWYFPSRAQCFGCHTPASGFTLGLEARQVDVTRFADRLDHAPPPLPALRGLDEPNATDEERARSYLHANCSICHREGSGSGSFDLRYEKMLAATKTCNAPPQVGDLGVADAKILAPGAPAKSTIALRMRALDGNRMPNVATRVVDEKGVAAVERWIASLGGVCP